jgi:hypothetical protein
MKKLFPLTILMLAAIACTLSFPAISFDRDVKTGVAVAFTQTAMAAEHTSQAATLTPEVTLTPVATFTQTPLRTIPSLNWAQRIGKTTFHRIKIGVWRM